VHGVETKYIFKPTLYDIIMYDMFSDFSDFAGLCEDADGSHISTRLYQGSLHPGPKW